MSKAHRGKGIRELISHGRGECPVCKRDSVKILYEMEAGEQKFKICKTCKAAIANGKKKLPIVDVAKPKEEVAPVAAVAAETPAVVEAPAAAPKAGETPAAPVAENVSPASEAPVAAKDTAPASKKAETNTTNYYFMYP